MPTCKYFIGKSLAHVAGGLAITAVSARYPIVYNALVSSTGAFAFIILALIQFALLFAIMSTTPNTIYKYSAWLLFVYFIGQLSASLVERLDEDNLLVRTLALTSGIFLGMMAVGFYDSQNMLGYQSYVIASLLGLIIVEIILDLLIYTKVVKGQSSMRVLSFIGVGIFAVLTGIDVQVLKNHAKKCSSNPDYVDESISLFLDFINLFTRIGMLTESS